MYIESALKLLQASNNVLSGKTKFIETTSVYSLRNLLNVDRIFIEMKNEEVSNNFGQYSVNSD